ncbi:MAG: PaaI family thioesterase [Bacteroidota bacterium]
MAQDIAIEEHFRRLERMYLRSKITEQIYETTTIKISCKSAEISLDIQEKYYHALGAIHGSIYFKLLDDAAFFAVNSVVLDKFVLTSNFSLNLLRPEKEGKLTAKGSLRFQSRNLFIADASLINEKGREIGFGTGHFMKSNIDLTEEIGYK